MDKREFHEGWRARMPEAVRPIGSAEASREFYRQAVAEVEGSSRGERDSMREAQEIVDRIYGAKPNMARVFPNVLDSYVIAALPGVIQAARDDGWEIDSANAHSFIAETSFILARRLLQERMRWFPDDQERGT